VKSDRVRRAVTLFFCLLVFLVVALGTWQGAGVEALAIPSVPVPTTVPAIATTTTLPPVPTTVPASTFVYPPSVLFVHPDHGATTGSNWVSIIGHELDGATAVTFGGTPGAIVKAEEWQITALTPAHAAGTVDVQVTTPGGTGTCTNGYTYEERSDTTLPSVPTTVPAGPDLIVEPPYLASATTTVPATTVDTADEGGLAGGYIALIIVAAVALVGLGGWAYARRRGSPKA
jgi:hypothetical protein